MLKTGVLGHGSYGTVYEAVSPRGNLYAVKRNFNNESIRGIGPIRESDLMMKLAHHQHLVNIRDMRTGVLDKGSLSPPPSEMSADLLYFVMKKADTDLEQLIHYSITNNYSFRKMKTIMVQILLAVEFLHKSGVIHRDLKPGNVLINESSNDKDIPHARVCDFGMSIQWTRQGPMTPEVYTPTYRAPEVCIGQLRTKAKKSNHGYTYAADVWSLGCILYFMISGSPLLPGIIEVERQLVAILQYCPDYVKPEDVERALGKAYDPEIDWDQRNMRNENLPFEARAVPKLIESRFNVETASYSDFGVISSSSQFQYVDLLKRMLKWNPSERITATECLDHPWFVEYRDLIIHMRRVYQPVVWNSKIEMFPCVERKWAGRVAIDLYNNWMFSSDNDLYLWFSYRILFHSLAAFDRWMGNKLSTASPDSSESEENGRVYTRIEAEAVFWSLVYLYTKYFHINTLIPEYEKIVPAKYREDGKLQALMDHVEAEMIRKANLYHVTLYEACELVGFSELDDHQVGDLILMYTSCRVQLTGSVYDAVRTYQSVCVAHKGIVDNDERKAAIQRALIN